MILLVFFFNKLSGWVKELVISSREDAFQFYESAINKIHEIYPPVSEEEFQKENTELIMKTLEIYKQFLFGFETLFESGLPQVKEELEKRTRLQQEVNLKKVFAVLKEEKSRRFAQHESMLDSIELPIPTDHLEMRMEEVRKEVIERFSNFAEKYKNGKSYQDNLQLLEVNFIKKISYSLKTIY